MATLYQTIIKYNYFWKRLLKFGVSNIIAVVNSPIFDSVAKDEVGFFWFFGLLFLLTPVCVLLLLRSCLCTGCGFFFFFFAHCCCNWNSRRGQIWTGGLWSCQFGGLSCRVNDSRPQRGEHHNSAPSLNCKAGSQQPTHFDRQYPPVWAFRLRVYEL